jgi:hypothetical protein
MLPDGGQRRPSKPAAESAPDTDSVTRIAGLNTQIQLLQRTLVRPQRSRMRPLSPGSTQWFPTLRARQASRI